MRIGPMRERVTIQQESTVADDMGGTATTWVSITDAPDVWARVEPIAGREIPQAMQLQGPHTHRVTMRYRSDVTLAMRLLWGSTPLNIRAIVIDEKRAFTQLMVEQGVAT